MARRTITALLASLSLLGACQEQAGVETARAPEVAPVQNAVATATRRSPWLAPVAILAFFLVL